MLDEIPELTTEKVKMLKVLSTLKFRTCILFKVSESMCMNKNKALLKEVQNVLTEISYA